MGKNNWLILLALTTLTGCAGMDKSQCVTADWRTIGFEDGVAGKAQSAIGQHRKDCAEYGVAPDLGAYRQGHAEGIVRFCTINNGFVVGRSGANYQNSCPATLEAGFLTGFRDGQQLYKLQRDVSKARSAFDKQQRLLASLEQDIEEKTELMVKDGQSRDERIALLKEIDNLKLELVNAAQLMPVLEQNIHFAEQALARGEQKFTGY